MTCVQWGFTVSVWRGKYKKGASKIRMGLWAPFIVYLQNKEPEGIIWVIFLASMLGGLRLLGETAFLWWLGSGLKVRSVCTRKPQPCIPKREAA